MPNFCFFDVPHGIPKIFPQKSGDGQKMANVGLGKVKRFLYGES